MTSRRTGIPLAIALTLTLVSGVSTFALTDEEVFRDFRFNFINPGARALALGGAYIAAADDATAAEANPAALHYISTFEVFAEYRAARSDPQFFNSGGAINRTELAALLPLLDLGTVNRRDDEEFPSFVSFAIPFKRGRSALAFSRTVMLNVTNVLDQSENTLDFAFPGFPIWANPNPLPTPGDPNPMPGRLERYTILNTSSGSLETTLVNYNVSFSAGITRHLSIGVTATSSELDMKSRLDNRANDPRGILVTVNPRDTDNDGTIDVEQVLTSSQIQDESDSDFTYTVGLHYHPDSKFKSGLSPVRLGVVYRKGADLSVTQRLSEADATGTLVETETFPTSLRVPDRYGFGVAGDFGEKKKWTLALDLERIEYSDLLEGFKEGVNFFTSDQIDPAALSLIENTKPTFIVDDATVVHFGMEYSFATRGWAYGFRGGLFNAPDNRIRMTEFNSDNPEVNERYLEVFRGGESEDHFTVGFSATAPIGLQLQFAADFSGDEEQFLLSSIYRFGKTRR